MVLLVSLHSSAIQNLRAKFTEIPKSRNIKNTTGSVLSRPHCPHHRSAQRTPICSIMSTFIPGGKPQGTVEAERHAIKVNKACVPCHARKIKCDAMIVGLPCSSCKSRQQCTEDCVPLVRKGRTRSVDP